LEHIVTAKKHKCTNFYYENKFDKQDFFGKPCTYVNTWYILLDSVCRFVVLIYLSRAWSIAFCNSSIKSSLEWLEWRIHLVGDGDAESAISGIFLSSRGGYWGWLPPSSPRKQKKGQQLLYTLIWIPIIWLIINIKKKSFLILLICFYCSVICVSCIAIISD
jgi:hypothetical protein